MIEVDALPTVLGDRVQLRQILQNLLSNALKFHRTDVPLRIRVACASSEGGRCTVTVADNGIGFDDEYAERIFGTFQRLHGRSEYEGTGIGLSIARKIAWRHDGDITAKGTAGEGATFTLTLRQAPAAAEQPRARESKERRMTANALPGVTILLADDDEEDRAMTISALRERRVANEIRCVGRRLRAVPTTSSTGVLQPTRTTRPSPVSILLDLNMPKKDGREVLAEIKADASLRSIPVVVLTTSKAEEDIARTYNLGVNSFITKPVTFDGLVKPWMRSRATGSRSSSCPTSSLRSPGARSALRRPSRRPDRGQAAAARRLSEW